ncbi:uncharacterized protein B0I36DRAFT_361212 [Microdochium trichocladiopsis]|uniref:Cyclin-dependent kinase n=1 Tax=Microdochium trichocladiopsis TaxID=1682393 RepID=A0A9P9BTF1_9PEZI|nr:uncharacterized protein B0I36DRAFT_361212 [Microdochium trichocladiopsis]KAH7035895.1 hypothetical protein B0I36DRAFT_361212 [Microdochium trichocladiopsis]
MSQTTAGVLPAPDTAHGHGHDHSHGHPHHDSSTESQSTTATTDITDRVFTPPGSDSGRSSGNAPAAPSSQDSQLFQLSELAAARDKIPEADNATAVSRKRTADGAVKHTRNGSMMSPTKPGHSRNTSTVSVASTAGSRIGELSAELRAKLSYAMVKVNNGWQGHSIDEVESLASQVASPTSSTSTIHARNRASASPRVAFAPNKLGYGSTATSPAVQYPPSTRGYDSVWKDNVNRPRSSTSPTTAPGIATLAPPAPIRAGEHNFANPRRNSNAKYTPAYLSNASPHTPAQPSPLQSTPGQTTLRTPQIDPILFSPHQNFREQEALETLVFMSSPGNSANMKHNFPSSQGSQAQGKAGVRTALPTSRLGPGVDNQANGRKSLPSGRPQQTPGTHAKHVGFAKSPSNLSAMDVDEPQLSPQNRGTPRRRTLGSGPRPSLSTPAGLGGAGRSRPALQDVDIERMLDRVAAAGDSSDSEGEISLPHDRRTQQGAAGVGA